MICRLYFCLGGGRDILVKLQAPLARGDPADIWGKPNRLGGPPHIDAGDLWVFDTDVIMCCVIFCHRHVLAILLDMECQLSGPFGIRPLARHLREKVPPN